MPKSKKKFGTGLLDDNRTNTEKSKDYKAEEVAASFAVEWLEKDPTTWRRFPIFNQNGSSSCVANATAKVLGIENFLEEGEFVPLSPRDIYTRRINDSEGMFFYDALDIASKHGATLEPLMPSQGLSEEEMNKTTGRKKYTEQIGKVFKAGGYVQLPFDIDAIASIIQKGKGVLLGFRFNYSEWNRDVPVLETNRPQLHHGVAGTNVTLWKGEKAIVIDDSWGIFGQFKGQRVVTQKFLEDRITFAGYLLDLSNDWREKGDRPKPKHTFTTELRLGQKNDDIKALQDILKFEELFPQNADSTGYYGEITRKSVLAFQRKHQVATEDELIAVDGKIVGQKTIVKLNTLYA